MITGKDLEILHALDFHARDPVTALAKRLRIGKEMLNYRLKRLERLGVISGYQTLPDPTKMGNATYKIAIKYQSMTKEAEEEMLAYLVMAKETGWVVKTEGAYDLMFMAFLPDDAVFGRFLTDFLERYGSFFYLREMLIVSENHALRRDYLSKKPAADREILSYAGSARNVCDETDFRILDFLQKRDARASNMEIGAEIGLTAEAVRQRISALVRKGVILAFRPKIELVKIGHLYYNVMFSLKDLKALPSLYSYAESNPNITFFVRYLGRYDLGIDIEVENPDHLRRILDEIRVLFGSALVNYDFVQIYEELKITY